MTPTDADPVGTVEIEERTGWPRKSIETWRHRGQFPPPRWTVGGRPAWDWTDLKDWKPPRQRGA